MPLAVLATAIAWGPRADAQEADSLQKVVELNKRALAAYSNLDVEEAAKLLKQALDVCASQKLETHPMAARTHVHLGVVYVAALKQRDQGLEEFKKALRIDPTIKVTKSMVNPEVQAAFAEAFTDVSEGAEGEGSASAPAQPEPPAAQPVEPARPAEPAPPAQPAPAAESAIVHTPVTEGTPGQPIAIKAQVPASLGAERVALAYRPDGVSDFVTREMDPAENSDLYQSQIPPEATGGASVAYYIAAQNADGKVLAQNGTATEPHVVNLSGEGGGEGGEGEVAGEGGEEGQGLSLWFVLAAGSGFGYHSGTPEANHTNDRGDSLKSSGLAMSRLLQIAPEAGFFLSDSLVLSLQGRIQIVSGASEVKGSQVVGNTGACKGGTCHPAGYALAALAKATWFVGEPRRVTPFLTLAAGAGQIRHVVDLPKQNLSGCPPSGCKDTVMGGPVLFGPGVGITIELSDSFSLAASANALVGVPNIMANLDVNLGLVYVR